MKTQEDTSVPTTRAKNSDACVVVYSISDRTSFEAAHEALIALQTNNSTSCQRKSFEDDNKEEHEINLSPLSVPVVLLANKKDLGHLRQVSYANWNASQIGRKTQCQMNTRLEQTVETGKNASTAGLWRCWQSPCSKIEMSVSWVQWTKKPDEYRKWRMDFFPFLFYRLMRQREGSWPNSFHAFSAKFQRQIRPKANRKIWPTFSINWSRKRGVSKSGNRMPITTRITTTEAVITADSGSVPSTSSIECSVRWWVVIRCHLNYLLLAREALLKWHLPCQTWQVRSDLFSKNGPSNIHRSLVAIILEEISRKNTLFTWCLYHKFVRAKTKMDSTFILKLNQSEKLYGNGRYWIGFSISRDFAVFTSTRKIWEN